MAYARLFLTLVSFWCLLLFRVPPVLKSFHRDRISWNMSETQLQSCHQVLAVDGNIATKSWSMLDEGSFEVTPEVERILTQVSTVQMFVLVFLVRSRCTSFVEWILQCFCFPRGGSLVNFVCVCT